MKQEHDPTPPWLPVFAWGGAGLIGVITGLGSIVDQDPGWGIVFAVFGLGCLFATRVLFKQMRERNARLGAVPVDERDQP